MTATTVAICPYCRTPIESDSGNELVCAGCGTPHHADCYAENGGCTVFGCSAAPAEEPKVRLTGSDLNPAPVATTTATTTELSLPMPAPAAPAPPPPRVKAAPPPLPPGATPAPSSVPIPRFGSASVLFGMQPVAAVATAAPAVDMAFEPDPEAKNRMTFIVLGVLLGAFGAHNFYAGYRGKGVAQLLITLISLGFASPMTWIWAVIDVWTVDRDAKGIKFRS
jgi:TM2 domain-containing membrane protein YozV